MAPENIDTSKKKNWESRWQTSNNKWSDEWGCQQGNPKPKDEDQQLDTLTCTNEELM